MLKRTFCIFLTIAFVIGPLSAWGEPVWRRIGDRLSISGTKTYTLQSLSVDGSEEMFLDDNYGYSSRYRNETNLTVSGNLWPGLSITASLSNNRWNPNDRTVTLNYNKGNTKASIGDISASLPGNELIPFSKRLKGATVTHDFGSLSVTALASRSKAATRTVSLSGNNTPGPYYLGVSQIVDGSERVKIDEQDIPRSDNSGISNYMLDAFSGILTFRDDLIVPSTSTISVSFEAQSYNSTSGTIYGMRTDVPVGKKAGIGLTYLTQSSDDSTSIAKEITESFHGNNSLALPYELLYIPMEGSVIVKVDGVLQSPLPYGTSPEDYRIDYQLHYILFTRPIMSTSTILVTYIPKPENAVTGNRNVMGVDAKYKVSEALTLTGQFAKSSSDYTGAGDGGSAGSLRAAGKYGKLDYTATLRNIDAKFAPIESTGFFRNERGGNIDLKYKFSDQLSWYTRIDKFKRPSISSAAADTALSVNTTQSTSGIEWNPVKLPEIKLTRTRMDSGGANDWKDSLATDSFSVNWGGKKLSASGEFSRSERESAYTSAFDGSLVATNNKVDTSRLSLRYTPGQKVSFIADVSNSDITNSNGSTSDAKNYQITATYVPTSALNLSTSYRISDSGSANTSGIGPGWGGYQNGGYINSYGLKSATRTVNVGWSPSQKFSFNSSFDYTSSEGENSTNTSVSGTDLGFTYNPSEIITLHAHTSRQNGNFIGANGNMSSRIGFVTFSIGPVRKHTLDLNYQKMLSGTVLSNIDINDPLYAYQNSTVDLKSISGVLRREISGGRYLFTEFLSSSTSGITSSKKSVYAFGIEYPLNEILGLKVDWRIIDYSDPRNPASNYRANMLNAQIGARFR